MTASYQLGKYLVEEELGRGGFANVYKATDTNLGRAVALKILDPLLMRDAQWVARFRREARAVALLEHPHIVPVYEIDEIDGRMFIAMKYINGPNLSVFIQQKGHLTWNQTLHILRQITDALDYAHVKGVIHRDLKPGNILVDDTWHAYLSDFGFAGMVGESQYSVSLSGGIVGTPAYIAPEIWDGQVATSRTDIYAIGCILYEMVTGKALFTGNSTPSVMRSHFHPRTLPQQWSVEIPEQFTAILQKALAINPYERYAHGNQLVAATHQKAIVKPSVSSNDGDSVHRPSKRVAEPSYPENKSEQKLTEPSEVSNTSNQNKKNQQLQENFPTTAKPQKVVAVSFGNTKDSLQSGMIELGTIKPSYQLDKVSFTTAFLAGATVDFVGLMVMGLGLNEVQDSTAMNLFCLSGMISLFSPVFAGLLHGILSEKKPVRRNLLTTVVMNGVLIKLVSSVFYLIPFALFANLAVYVVFQIEGESVVSPGSFAIVSACLFTHMVIGALGGWLGGILSVSFRRMIRKDPAKSH